MEDPRNVDHSPDAAAFQAGDRVASITPPGQAISPPIMENEGVKALAKAPGTPGEVGRSDVSEPRPGPVAGCGTQPPGDQPDHRVHEGGDPSMDGDAQYGASPIRSARYDENHEANADISEGRLRSGHHGAQARYPKPEDATSGPTGHDEQQVSRDLANSGR